MHILLSALFVFVFVLCSLYKQKQPHLFPKSNLPSPVLKILSTTIRKIHSKHQNQPPQIPKHKHARTAYVRPPNPQIRFADALPEMFLCV